MRNPVTVRRGGSRFRIACGVVFAVLLSVAALGGAAVPGGATPPALTVVKTGLPGSVTRGYKVLYTVTLTNHATTANHVTMTDPAPTEWRLAAGTTITSATPSVGTCTIAADAASVTCDVGQMAAEQVATFKIVVKTTTDTTVNSFTNTAVASLNESGNDKEAPAQHQDTFSDTVTTNLVAAGDPTFAQGYFDTGCDASIPNDPSLLYTDPNVDTDPNVGAGNVQSTQACVADIDGGTTISVGESSHTTGSPGFSEVSTICVPVPGGDCTTSPLTFSTPATFTFNLSPLELPQKFSLSKLIVYHGTDVVAWCNPGGAIPTGATACKFSVTQDNKTKIVTVVVKSLSNGEWTF